MRISGVPEDHLRKGPVGGSSAAIVDGGFRRIPKYATVYGPNPRPDDRHGNRMLSIFRAPDAEFPLDGFSLRLSCYDPKDGYDGLAKALDRLPASDVLSISLAWRDDVPEIRRLLAEKAGLVFVPYPNDRSTPYPAAYPFARTCFNGTRDDADYCICPNPEWKGNSYAVPAVARLACHGTLHPFGIGVPVARIFAGCLSPAGGRPPARRGAAAGPFMCGWCGRTLVDPVTHRALEEMPESCPYCGRRAKKAGG